MFVLQSAPPAPAAFRPEKRFEKVAAGPQPYRDRPVDGTRAPFRLFKPFLRIGRPCRFPYHCPILSAQMLHISGVFS